jgi:beta-lactamase regulating signal transducer with metallopeptidase domain
MSITATFVAVVVMIVRLLLKKAPKIFSYVLWSIVLFRLLCPFTIESSISMIPVNTDTISSEIVYSQNPEIQSNIEIIDNFANDSIENSIPPVNPTDSVNPMGVLVYIASLVWIIGIVILVGYGMVTYFKLKYKLSTATLVDNNIYETDRIQTPFVLGLFKPRIFIPTSLSEYESDYIIKHEEIHVKRYDHLVKLVGFAALAIHWFNPIIWLSFYLMVKDMEMSCDESVMKVSKADIRRNYSETLLSISSRQSGMFIPLAFGESNVKSRIRNILNYKRPRFWIIIMAVLILTISAAVLISNPRDDEPDLSMLNINVFLKSIGTGDGLVAETEDNGRLFLSPEGELLEIFNQNEWKEKKVDSPYERSFILRLYLDGGYFVSFYSDEKYAMVYFRDGKEKYRYYEIPDGTYEKLEGYILEKGQPWGDVIPNVSKDERTDDAEGMEIGVFQVKAMVDKNLEIIMSSPMESSNPQDYMDAHDDEYQNIVKLGDEALDYMLYEFRAGDQEGLREHIMMKLSKEILGVRNNVNDDTLSPREWYEALSIRMDKELPDYSYDGLDIIEGMVYFTEVERSSQPNRGFTVVAPKIFASYEEEEYLKVFTTTYSVTYKLYDNILEVVSGGVIPAAITYKKEKSKGFVLVDYEQVMDGSDFAASIGEYCKMPVSGQEIKGLAEEILKHYGNYDDLFDLQRENLLKHLKKNGIKDATLYNYKGEIEFSIKNY